MPPPSARPFAAAEDGVAARLLLVLATDDGGRGLADDPSISRFSRIDWPMVDLPPLVGVRALPALPPTPGVLPRLPPPPLLSPASSNDSNDSLRGERRGGEGMLGLLWARTAVENRRNGLFSLGHFYWKK